MARHKDVDWTLTDKGTPADGGATSYKDNTILFSLLMDLRDELKRLNSLLYCPNFTGIPNRLRLIEKAIKDKKPRPRICWKCKGPINLGHKWRMDGGRCHLDCKDPKNYPRGRR